jgi:chromosome segregation ATPase
MPRFQEKSVYKSPERKLVKFFEKSRNKWKAKARDSKRVMKRLKNRIRFLEASRARWKDKAKRLEAQLTAMQAHEHAREAALEALKKSPVLR